jgi:glycosyltransferase involved in cell wall biosynthesis
VIRVAVIYFLWPHYRAAVVRAMDRSSPVAYTFMSDPRSFEGIPHMPLECFESFRPAPFHRLFGRFFWQPEALRAALNDEFDAIIFLGDPNILSTWVAAAICRLRGVPVLFWAHGWRQEERGPRRLVRNLFFRLANRLLVYAERAKRLGARSGYPDERITPVYNSLDVDAADLVVAQIENGSLATADPGGLFEHEERPLIVCTARLTRACRFDLLVEAAALLARKGKPINILLIGDGAESRSLAELARQRDVDLHLFGACYDERVIGQLIYRSDLTVSPGKIGLTAMHSLMYGTPAITHDDLDEQMPEVEALTDGVTGKLFRRGDATSLADAIGEWLGAGRDRAALRAACRAAVHDKWNPHVQAQIIERAVLELVGRKQPEGSSRREAVR